MPAGSSVNMYENVSDAASAQDGRVGIRDALSVRTSDFAKERDLQDFICVDIEGFCEFLGEKYVSHETNARIQKKRISVPNGRRADLVIQCEDAVLVVELKNPRSGTENRAGLGQLLDYGREFTDAIKKQMILVTSWFDVNTARTIKHYGLPIRYVYMSREQTMEFVSEGVVQ